MRSILLVTLVLCYKAVFGQATLEEAAQVKVPPPQWAVSTVYAGNDSFMDHGRPGGLLNTVAWDPKQGGGAMNSRSWLQSLWMGEMAKLCSVESSGKVSTELRWIGKGAAPESVVVDVDSSMYARYYGSMIPTILLANGLGSKTTYSKDRRGMNEAIASGLKTMNLPVQNGVAKFSFSISGRVSAMTTGMVALRSELKIRPR